MSFFDEGVLVSVLTTQPIDRLLDYKAPEGGCQSGAFVEVPLGPRKVFGVVWGPGEGGYDETRIRPVIRVLDVAPMREEMQEFLTRAADYTLTPMPAMLRLATRAPGLGDPPSMRIIYRVGRGRAGPEDASARPGVGDASGLWRACLYPARVGRDGGRFHARRQRVGEAGRRSEEASPRDLPYPMLDPTHAGSV